MPFRPNSLILYVDDVERSTDFYGDILSQRPVERFADFTVFALAGGFVLGLQSKHAIDPRPQADFGGFEVCFGDASRDEVDASYREWKAKGISIVMEPTELDFGYTFVALDPDGHRLRVCATDTSAIV